MAVVTAVLPAGEPGITSRLADAPLFLMGSGGEYERPWVRCGDCPRGVLWGLRVVELRERLSDGAGDTRLLLWLPESEQLPSSRLGETAATASTVPSILLSACEQLARGQPPKDVSSEPEREPASDRAEITRVGAPLLCPEE